MDLVADIMTMDMLPMKCTLAPDFFYLKRYAMYTIVTYKKSGRIGK